MTEDNNNNNDNDNSKTREADSNDAGSPVVENSGQAQPPAERRRRVVIGPRVRITFVSEGRDDVETKEVNRDVFSVMDAITERLSRTKDKAEMESVRVTVQSFEDEAKSEPRMTGEEPAVLPYLVAGLDVNGMSIPDAISELTKAIIPGDAAIRQYETLTEQLFLRSMLNCATVVLGFPTGNAIVPLINSMRDVDPRAVVGMYHGLIDSAEKLKEFVPKAFPDKEFDFSKNPSAPVPEKKVEEAPIQAPGEDRPKEVVLPSGFPASMADKGIVTAEEHRKTQIPVVHLT